ncbi:hypothetical protein ACFLY1_00415 [Patescibacteria group bacterium]
MKRIFACSMLLFTFLIAENAEAIMGTSSGSMTGHSPIEVRPPPQPPPETLHTLTEATELLRPRIRNLEVLVFVRTFKSKKKTEEIHRGYLDDNDYDINHTWSFSFRNVLIFLPSKTPAEVAKKIEEILYSLE